MPLLDLPEGRLFYTIDDWTDPWTDPQAVLMIHGFCENTEAWRAWPPLLGRRYRVIRFDQVGFGQSSPVTPESVFTTAGFVENAARVIAAAARAPVHVIGAKSGGLIAIELARLRPELVRTLTLASTPLAPPQPSQWLAHMEQHGMASWARATMAARLGSAMPAEGFEWWVELMGSTALQTARVYMRWVSSIDVGVTLNQVRCPTLVLTTSTPRRAYSRSDIDVYREKLPHARIEMLPGDGYHVAATDPEGCARIMLEFLARHA